MTEKNCFNKRWTAKQVSHWCTVCAEEQLMFSVYKLLNLHYHDSFKTYQNNVCLISETFLNNELCRTLRPASSVQDTYYVFLFVCLFVFLHSFHKWQVLSRWYMFEVFQLFDLVILIYSRHNRLSVTLYRTKWLLTSPFRYLLPSVYYHSVECKFSRRKDIRQNCHFVSEYP